MDLIMHNANKKGYPLFGIWITWTAIEIMADKVF